MREDVESFGNSVLINGTYNCNPGSLKAGIKMLADFPLDCTKIALIGDMYGLGEHSERLHKEIGETAEFNGISQVWLYGNDASLIAEGVKRRYRDIEVRLFTEEDDLIKALKEVYENKYLILAKASRAVSLDQIIKKAGEIYGN